jgi:hypothetical protein
MVNEVEGRETKLNVLPFRDGKCFVNGQVAVEVRRATEIRELAVALLTDWGRRKTRQIRQLM